MKFPTELQTIIQEQPYPLLFASLSGAHLYGFPSPDSDYDLRGVHILPPRAVMGLYAVPETVEADLNQNGLEIDLVTHDAKKFFGLMLKRNGYVLEQVFSPLVLSHTAYHDRLKRIAKDCITAHHAHHYMGFANTQWKLFIKQTPHKVKPLLYIYRVLLTGIHLMRSGAVEANLNHLNSIFNLPYIADLITQKIEGAEHGTLSNVDIAFHESEFQRLLSMLEDARDNSALPKKPSGKAGLNELLIELRVAQGLQ